MNNITTLFTSIILIKQGLRTFTACENLFAENKIKMKINKKLGIWMDHSSAHIMEFNVTPTETRTVNSSFTHQQKEASLNKGEHLMHNKEQHEQGEYYKKLSDIILTYDDVLLFGPTDAKVELLNTMKRNHLFDKIKIETKQADKMTENQKHAFVTDYFEKEL